MFDSPAKKTVDDKRAEFNQRQRAAEERQRQKKEELEAERKRKAKEKEDKRLRVKVYSFKNDLKILNNILTGTSRAKRPRAGGETHPTKQWEAKTNKDKWQTGQVEEATRATGAWGGAKVSFFRRKRWINTGVLEPLQ